MLNTLKNNWFILLIIAVLVLLQTESSKKTAFYKEEIIQLQIELEEYKKRDEELSLIIDSLSKVEKSIEGRIKTIKEKEYVQIKIVDTLSISRLQKFFTDRY